MRQLRTAEADLQHYRERDKAFTAGLEHLEAVLQKETDPAAIVKQLQQAQSEVRTALQVADRMHQLRMQELQAMGKFPDEP